MADSEFDNSQTGPVGYGRPPVPTRFQKGRSGNPKGRPKGSKNLRTLMLKELEQKVTITVDGKLKRLTKGAVIAKMCVQQAMTGDHKAREQILKLEETESRFDPSLEPETLEVTVVFPEENRQRDWEIPSAAELQAHRERIEGNGSS